MSGAVLRLVAGSEYDAKTRAGELRRLARSLLASARRAGAAAVASGRWLTDQVVDLAPHVPVRDLATLREHHPGLERDALAGVLIDSASRASMAAGVASGVVSSLEFAAPPMLLSSPVQVAAETVAVVAIELKLIAELHEVYGAAVSGTPAVRAAAYLGSWTRRRGLVRPDGRPAPTGMTGTLTGAARRELRRRLMRRAGTNTTSVLPFLTGAAASGGLNARETRKLGERIAKDLGGRFL